MLFLPLIIQVAKGRMLQPAYSDCVLSPVSSLCAEHLFVRAPPSRAAQEALARVIQNNMMSRYGVVNSRPNALVVATESANGGALLGACGVNVEKQPAVAQERVAVLSNLVVEPRARRRGIARKLVRKCEDEVRAWGFDKLYLKVEAPNSPARKLYEKLGYRTVMIDSSAQIPTATNNVFKRVQWVPADLVVMQKDLTAVRFPSFEWPF
ncbi:hypothetical protein KFE25_006382 [Diacronema lutheri]|uniref:N-acetyltransferase domain-containing protein n=1 Tax=Diacronema lutheri TaxID=2081491 RepID=A0A8J6CCI5_DIALT|nr:hypothetical protein KFE25_006382 [Diacronema lutheri]